MHYKELYSLLMIIANQWPCCEFLIKTLIFWICSKLMSLCAIQLKVIRMMAVFAFTHSPFTKVCVPFLADPLAVVKCLTFSSFYTCTTCQVSLSHTHTHTHTHTHYIKNTYSDQQASVSASSCSEEGGWAHRFCHLLDYKGPCVSKQTLLLDWSRLIMMERRKVRQTEFKHPCSSGRNTN